MRQDLLLAIFVAGLVGTGTWDICNRQARPATGRGPGTIEWAAFEGGYGIDFFEKVTAEFIRKHPDRDVLFWGNPRLDIQIQLRLLAGEAPDAIAPAWRISPIMLIGKGLVRPLDDILLDKQWPGDDKPFREYFRQDLLKWLQFKDDSGRVRTYALPIDCNASVMYYHKDLFRRHGWQLPRTWAELRALCETIKRAELKADDGRAVAPIALQGRGTYQLGIFDDLLQRIGGMELYLDCHQLRPGAWERPGVRRAAELLQRLFIDGYFQEGCLGMTHTEAQREFLLRHAAMVPGGAALVSEMKAVIDELARHGKTFELGVLPTPSVEGGRGDPGVIAAKTSLFWFIPNCAKDPEAAAELLHEMFRPELILEQWALPRQLLTSMRDIGEVPLPPATEEVRRVLDAAPKLRPRYQGRFYPGWHRVIAGAIDALSARTLTPRQFCEQMQAAAARVRKEQSDPNGWDDVAKVGMRGTMR